MIFQIDLISSPRITMLRISAHRAAGTIPDPPKIYPTEGGIFARTLGVEPSPYPRPIETETIVAIRGVIISLIVCSNYCIIKSLQIKCLQRISPPTICCYTDLPVFPCIINLHTGLCDPLHCYWSRVPVPIHCSSDIDTI